jgi:hypothetical protein
MRSGRTQEQLNNLAHRRYVAWATGDGVKLEFALPKNVKRLDDLLVFVGGVLKRPDEPGTVHHYAVRGLTPGYAGDANMVKLAAAPAVAVDLAFIVNAE